ncbi:hypothetical protein SeMB42_g05446 [Synchytrium endobioticum]|uniref:Uncharacterized protein n=1 Tax=Synchytrium endobioticum TaxID=286115 RepID=A0A507CRE6_9FUNG|nr:hypothetical protein SeLEV6574_g07678 [Synchytrium endobioticum]TPX41742.1 hypothetical protein SeMB42_g05446 [Synchytrium endobioticum]
MATSTKNKKRKFRKSSGGHDDDGHRHAMKRQQLLPLHDSHDHEHPDDDDLTAPPSDGYCYIRRVQKEACAIADIVSAKLPSNVIIYQTTHTIGTIMHDASVSTNASYHGRPSEEWVDTFITKFSLLRQALTHNQTAHPLLQLPHHNDKRHWHSFCYGRETINAGERATDDNDEDSEDAESAADQDEEKVHINPKQSNNANINHNTVWKLIQYHTQWLSDMEDDNDDDEDDVANILDARMGAWLFALLAKVDSLMTADQTSTLRELGKRFRLIRDRLLSRRGTHGIEKNAMVEESRGNDDVDSRVGILNMVIAIVGKFFRQLDLLD